MFKYYKELEHPSKYNLPTLKLNSSGSQIPAPIPISFFSKYETVFERLQILEFRLSHINLNLLFWKTIEKEDYCFDLKKMIFREDGEEFSELEQQRILSKQINISKRDMWSYLRYYSIVLGLLTKLEPDSYFCKSLLADLEKAYQEFRALPNFIYKKTEQPHFLPNAWYITSLGDLYNTGDGHKETNLVYLFQRVESLFSNSESESIFENISFILHQQYFEMKRRQGVTYEECVNYLNYNGDFFSFGNLEVKKMCYLNDKKLLFEKIVCDQRISFERNLFRLVLGVLSTQLTFYKFFRDIYCNAQNPKLEYEKLMCLKRDDIFIRCLGLNKIETCLPRTITTSSFHFIDDFHDYLSRGWNINFEYPYIMNQESRSIMDGKNLITEHYVENQILRYVREKKNTDGDILLSGRKL